MDKSQKIIKRRKSDAILKLKAPMEMVEGKVKKSAESIVDKHSRRLERLERQVRNRTYE